MKQQTDNPIMAWCLICHAHLPTASWWWVTPHATPVTNVSLPYHSAPASQEPSLTRTIDWCGCNLDRRIGGDCGCNGDFGSGGGDCGGGFFFSMTYNGHWFPVWFKLKFFVSEVSTLWHLFLVIQTMIISDPVVVKAMWPVWQVFIALHIFHCWRGQSITSAFTITGTASHLISFLWHSGIQGSVVLIPLSQYSYNWYRMKDI